MLPPARTGRRRPHAISRLLPSSPLFSRTALSIVRPGGAVGRVGLPQEESIPEAVRTFFDNVTIAGGPAPARAYIEELLPDVLEGRLQPGRVFDRTVPLDDVPDGYRAMNEREALKVLIRP